MDNRNIFSAGTQDLSQGSIIMRNHAYNNTQSQMPRIDEMAHKTESNFFTKT